ncbi:MULTISPECIES: flagellar motor switch protein FliM [unclassified Fusibacter]|uniref:flagellar motor switch protein FliM n=1 Tax=unclassified Fusibacter TaxID=2624464 RepID=UPI001011F2FD|nr:MULTISPECIES: flagellar motor switch protein FliM [unclassified Fusibacter]MCK8058768.1 flagellar motor switch protein FliM [Fusibacter sp. A2]NPE21842.1 flagellar motor switch protein FliM [Fusibacter sp. A1]RXV61414.1 flagellar motor switch protein FliM [Fusibacter sp. A1]
MSDVLSQNEIDDLLNALSAGEVDVAEIEEDTKEKKVKKYDFRRPDKFAKEQLRTLEIIHDNLARLINNFLSGYLRSVVEIDVLSTQSMVYSEFSNSISNPAILGIVNFSPLEGQIIVDISNDVAFSMVERLLGGMGKNPLLKEARALTEIEEVLIRNIIVKFINLMRESWANIIELKPKLENIETNSQFAQIVSPSESIALVTFNLRVGDTEGMINIAIPHYVIEPILPNLSSKLWFSGGTKREKTVIERQSLEERLERSKVPVKTIVGRSTISVSELLTLSVGDVVVLDNNAKSEFEIYVKDELKYFGKPGTHKNRMAVKVSRINEEGADNHG